jgi:peptide deformylase
MALLPIHVLGSPILRQETTPVADFGSAFQQLVDDMFETNRAASGVGIAAPQVGRAERLTVVEIKGQPLVLANPEIVEREGTIKWEEGCLSIPEVYGEVTRSARVVVRAYDRHGAPFEIEGEELLGVCLQHEIDHLHGRLFIDHLSFLKRRSALATWELEKSKYPDLLRHVVPGDGDDDEEHDDERL